MNWNVCVCVCAGLWFEPVAVELQVLNLRTKTGCLAKFQFGRVRNWCKSGLNLKWKMMHEMEEYFCSLYYSKDKFELQGLKLQTRTA